MMVIGGICAFQIGSLRIQGNRDVAQMGVTADLFTVADPGGGGPGPSTPVKTSQKKMAIMPHRKFCESSPPPPPDKFLDPLLCHHQVTANLRE